jgi:hypothetical protein
LYLAFAPEMTMTKNMRTLLLASTAIGLMMVAPAHAADSSATIKALQAQMNALQRQLNELQAQQQAQVKAQADKPTVVGESGKEILPGVKVVVGGFADVTGIYRSKNQTSDLVTPFNGIPFDGNVNAHQSEFRGSARATRLSLLTSGDVDKDMSLGAYFETDFLGAANTSNSLVSNSYTPRLRHAYATVDRHDWGFHFLGGQSWSLAAMHKEGMMPRKENFPAVIDVSLVPGTFYTRNVQVRAVKDFADKKVWVGLSLESPQVNLGGIAAPAGVNVNNVGSTGSFNGVSTYSTDVAPDIIGKVSIDPGWGHYEAFGLVRFFHDNTTANFTNNYATGYGGGVAAILPIIKGKLDFQANAAAGKGIGRYGPALLPDFAFDAAGGIRPLTEYMAMVGLIAKPTPTWTLYTYAGIEKVFRDDLGVNGIGYGSTFAGQDNSTCNVNGGACAAQNSSIWQVTPGFWKQVYKGNYGMMQVGAQYSLTRRNTFSDINGVAPHAYQNVVMTTFRYSPF